MIIGDEGEAYWRVSDSRSVPPWENRGHWVEGVAGEKVGPDSSKLRARGLAAECRALLGRGSPTLPHIRITGRTCGYTDRRYPWSL